MPNTNERIIPEDDEATAAKNAHDINTDLNANSKPFFGPPDANTNSIDDFKSKTVPPDSDNESDDFDLFNPRKPPKLISKPASSAFDDIFGGDSDGSDDDLFTSLSQK